VFVESESRRIGGITLPIKLLDCVHQGACVEIDASHEDRIAFLLQDYAHLFDDPAWFQQQLDRLIGLHSKEQVKHWHTLIEADARAELFGELIERHYDPAYQRSSRQHFRGQAAAQHFTFQPNAANSVEQAKVLLAQCAVQAAPVSSADVVRHEAGAPAAPATAATHPTASLIPSTQEKNR
jgi:tRNA 2-selenouridine synthase